MLQAKRNLRRRAAHGGFTLIELLCVLVILAILAAVVVPKLTGHTEQARIAAAKTQIQSFKTALASYEIDTGQFPSTEQGLDALVTNPGNLTGWRHSYIEKVPLDPWGHAYIYRCPGSNGKDFDLLSPGPDGQEGGNDDID